MYTKFAKGARITLWCEKLPCKEVAEEAEVSREPPAKKKFQTAREKYEEELDEIFSKLKEKHRDGKVKTVGETNSRWTPQ